MKTFPVPEQTTSASQTVDGMPLHGEATAGASLGGPNLEQSGPVPASRTGGATPPTGAKASMKVPPMTPEMPKALTEFQVKILGEIAEKNDNPEGEWACPYKWRRALETLARHGYAESCGTAGGKIVFKITPLGREYHEAVAR